MLTIIIKLIKLSLNSIRGWVGRVCCKLSLTRINYLKKLRFFLPICLLQFILGEYSRCVLAQCTFQIFIELLLYLNLTFKIFHFLIRVCLEPFFYVLFHFIRFFRMSIQNLRLPIQIVFMRMVLCFWYDLMRSKTTGLLLLFRGNWNWNNGGWKLGHFNCEMHKKPSW